MDHGHLQRIGIFSHDLLVERSLATGKSVTPLAAKAAPAERTAEKKAEILTSVPEKQKKGAAAKPAPSPEKQRSANFEFIDIGVNLLDPMFQGTYREKDKHQPDLDAVLDRAYAAGVSKMMVTAGNLAEARDAIDMCKAHGRGLACTVGVHPTNCSAFDAYEHGPDAYMRELYETAKEALATSAAQGLPAPVVAIGEFGLDYARLEFCPKEVQLKYFEMQLRELAKPLGLPLFLHCRTGEAAQDLYALLRKNVDCWPQGTCPGVVHSFDGALDDAMLFIELGFAIGINGCSLKTAENLDVVRQLPIKSIMLETDAPWCNIRPTHAGASFVRSFWEEVKKPEKWEAGKCVKDRNEPCHIAQVFEVIVGARDVPEPERPLLAADLCRRARQVFFPKSDS